MKEENTNSFNPPNQDVEIDFIALFRIIWNKRKFIIFISAVFFFIGIIVSSFQTSNLYKAETTFLIKSSGSSGNLGSASNLTALIGIGSGSSSGALSSIEISPSLYPTLISSIDFKKQLISATLISSELNKEITYAKYYEEIVKPSKLELIKNYLLNLPSNILNFINPPNEEIKKEEIKKEEIKIDLLMLSSTEMGHFARLDNQLKIEFKDGVMNLSFSMSDPYLAAQMAQFSFDLLQKEVIEYKLGNLNEELRFSKSLYEEKKEAFEKIQQELGYFRDRNQNVIASSVQNQSERLKSEYNLRLNVVTQMANSLESTKIQISRDTPIFTILNPVTIPNSPEPKNKFFLLTFFTVLGIVSSFGFVLVSEFFVGFREKWLKEN
jgi:uncharacterized protein involved in exopolysaccharide biosynthesis